MSSDVSLRDYIVTLLSGNVKREFRLSSGKVGKVFLVLVADRFQNIAVGNQDFSHLDSERSGVHLRIVYRDGQIHVAEVAPVESLLDAQSLAVGMPQQVEPG